MPLHTDEGLELRQKVDEPLFPEERPGWKGYIEWEKYPEKKQKAAEILKQYNFPPVSHADAALSHDLHTHACSHRNSNWTGIDFLKAIRSWKESDGNSTIRLWALH